MSQLRYLTAQEAAAQLGVRLPTLYAYVSRGLIRSEASGKSQRDRRYHAEDVQRLKQRREQRRDPTRAAAQALDWGAPVLESALTLISEGKIYYRSQEAVTLASQHSVEEVAALLWTGDTQAQIITLSEPPTKSARAQMEKLISYARAYPLIEAFQMALLRAASDDPTAYDLRPSAVAQTGGRILRLLTAVAAGQVSAAPMAQTLAQSWMPSRQVKVIRLLTATLILLADHELNISSFTARCVASAGATPYQVVVAGLAALQGVKHGGNVNRVEALLDEIREPANAHRVLSRRLKRGDLIPGFGHKLYPADDPRGRVLLHWIAEVTPRSPALSLANVVIQETKTLIGEEPTIDFALAVLTRALGLAEGYGLGLFALGRTLGWLAHAIEHYQSNRMIRPRARYTGVLPHMS